MRDVPATEGSALTAMLDLLFIFVLVVLAIAAERLASTSWAPFSIAPYYVVLAFYYGTVMTRVFICAPIFFLFAIADALVLGAAN